MKSIGDNRSLAYLLLLAVAMAGATTWCWTVLTDQRGAALAAAQDLAASRELAARIGSLRRTSAATEGEYNERQLRQKIDEAVRTADIDTANLATIQNQPPRRLGDTGYQERPTQILLRDVSIQQATTFFHAIANGGDGAEVKSIRLSAAREQGADDRWTAEGIVTYLAPSPRRSQDGSGLIRSQ